MAQNEDGGAHQQGKCHYSQSNSGNHGRWRVSIRGRFHSWLERVFAARAHEVSRALAHGAGEVGETHAAVFARELVAEAGVHRAVLAGEAEGARAAVVVDSVEAGSAVPAGIAGTVVDVGLAARAGEAWLTATHDDAANVKTLSTCRQEKNRCVLITTGGNNWQGKAEEGRCSSATD